MEFWSNVIGVTTAIMLVVILQGFIRALEMHWVFNPAAMFFSGLVGATVTTIYRIYFGQNE